MFDSNWTDNVGHFALGAIGFLIHGTGTALIATGRVVEFCGEALQVLAETVTASSRRRRPRHHARDANG